MSKAPFYISSFIIRFAIIFCIGSICSINLSYSQADEEEQPWNITSGGEYYSRYTSYGIDLSEGQSAVSIQSEISHELGFNAGVEVFALTGTNSGYEHSSFHGGYEYPLSSFFRLNGTYTYHSYATDTANVLAGIANELSFTGTLTIGTFALDAAYTTFFGGGNASYGTAGASVQLAIGELSMTPAVHLSIASQTVSETLLPKNRNQGKSKKQTATTIVTTTVTINGISNFTASAACRYPAGKGFTVSFTPAYVYSPTDLALSRSQLTVTFGVEHSIDF